MVQVVRQFNRDLMLERLGGDEELMREVVDLFVSECPGMLAETEKAVASADADLIKRAAHTLKGALLNIAAEPAADVARKLEQLGSREHLDETQGVLEDLRRCLDALQSEIRG